MILDPHTVQGLSKNDNSESKLDQAHRQVGELAGLTAFLAFSIYYCSQEAGKLHDVDVFWVKFSGRVWPKEDLIIFFVSYSDSPRVKTMNDYILANRNLSTIPFRYFFVDAPATDSAIPNLIVPPRFWELRKFSRNPPMNRDLLIKYIFCNRYFLEQTNCRWKVRICDDTLVNFAKLGKFILSMNERHNPLTEFVLKAHCARWNSVLYPQGGSGTLMSRFACEISTKHEIDLLLNSSRLWDDTSIGLYMMKHGFPAHSMAVGFSVVIEL
jgi:hypothetical protein